MKKLLERLRVEMSNARIRVPSSRGLEWRRDGNVVHLEMGARLFEKNLQCDEGSSPAYLICLAYWWEHFTGDRLRCQLHVRGAPSDTANTRRALFALAAYRAALGDRFLSDEPDRFAWPRRSMFNAPSGARDSSALTGGGVEAEIERAFVREPHLTNQLSELVEPVDGFQRQFPVGIFDGRVARANELLPGRNAQIDLWARSSDDQAVHLFELKKPGNRPLGIFPQALVYALLLHRARVGLDDGRTIGGSWAGLDAVRSAKRLSMWLLAPSLHPLLLHDGRSPFEWFQRWPGLRFGHVEYRMTPSDISLTGASAFRSPGASVSAQEPSAPP